MRTASAGARGSATNQKSPTVVNTGGTACSDGGVAVGAVGHRAVGGNAEIGEGRTVEANEPRVGQRHQRRAARMVTPPEPACTGTEIKHVRRRGDAWVPDVLVVEEQRTVHHARVQRGCKAVDE